jgi:subtilisin family serine protease
MFGASLFRGEDQRISGGPSPSRARSRNPPSYPPQGEVPMHRSVPARLVLPLVALSLAACTDQTTPTRTLAPSSSSANLVAASAAAGSYIVVARGDNFSKDFTAQVQALGGTVRSVHNGSGLAVVSGLSADAAAKLSATSGIAEVDADAVVSIGKPQSVVAADALDMGALDVASSAADPSKAARFAFQWDMRDIGAPAAWAAGKLGSKNVTVAIIDTGIDYDGLDMNGLVDLNRSISFTAFDDTLLAQNPGRRRFADFNDHGTNVASQVSTNGIGTGGVTSRTTLMAVKVLGQSGSGLTSDVLNGILYAADNGADVANMSLGGSFSRAGNGRLVSLLTRVVNYARKKGMLIVVAAGNDGTDLDHNQMEFNAYCDLQNVMCVSSVGPVTPTSNPDAPAIYSNFGRAVDVAAPGGNYADPFIVSVWPWGTHVASFVWSVCSKNTIDVDEDTHAVTKPCASGGSLRGLLGTSQAAPHVTGLAASLIAEYGKQNPNRLRLMIEQSADQVGKPGKDAFYGWGRINVARALGVLPATH